MNETDQKVQPRFRWGLEVRGARLERDAAMAFFGPNSDPCVQTLRDRAGNDIFVLTSSQFEVLDKAGEVHSIGTVLLTLVNGALFATDRAFEPMEVGPVREWRSDGTQHQTVVVGQAVAQIPKKTALEEVAAAKDHKDGNLPQVRWVALGQSDDRVADVMAHLARNPDWLDLYKAFEIMRDDINEKLGGQHRESDIGWPIKKDIDQFTMSAQVYRHARNAWPPGYSPDTALDFYKARSFVQMLARKWLEWRSSP